jgi:AcrR family transcriptional regulator
MTVRPERMPADEVRKRMLNAGRELALESGAALTIEHMRMEEAIQRARVPRSSVYRLWPYKDDYIDDLLCYIAGPGSWFSDRPAHDPETADLVKGVLTGNEHLMATPEGRQALLREMVRVSVTLNYELLSESAHWRLHTALIATLGSTRSDETRRKIAAALEAAQSVSRDAMVELFGFLASALGFRLRDPARTVEHMQLAGGLLVQGMALRNVQVRTAMGDTGEVVHVDALLNAPLPGPGLNGEPAQWSLAAFAYLGVLEAFVEPDPDFGALAWPR